MWWWLVPVASGLAAVAFWKPLRRIGHEIHFERARESFLLERERLEAKFLEAAAVSGKPRGLRWKDCAFERSLELARNKKTRELLALVPATISFEAIEGGPMEGVEAVGNLRNATAVFTFHRGRWTTAGRALFNMNPDEALTHLAGQVERVIHP